MKPTALKESIKDWKTTTEVEYDIVEISPNLAKEWLEKSNFDNRRLDERNVHRIARDIKKGNWVFDGNPIRFDKNGNVLDGQHRLQAIVQSGKTVKSGVITDLDEAAKNVIDSGKSRSIADILHFNGHVNNTALASALRLSIGFKKCKGDMNEWKFTRARDRLSTHELLTEATSNKDIINAVQNVYPRKTVVKLMGGGTAALCWMIFHRIDYFYCENFFLSFEKGTNLEDGSPILALRNYLMFNAQSYEKSRGGNYFIAVKIALIIKAWNAYRSKKSVQRLKYDPETEKAFPVAK